MIKKILCKLGFHRYERRDIFLTHSIGTLVNCKWCGKDLPSQNMLTREQLDKKIDKMLKEPLS